MGVGNSKTSSEGATSTNNTNGAVAQKPPEEPKPLDPAVKHSFQKLLQNFPRMFNHAVLERDGVATKYIISCFAQDNEIHVEATNGGDRYYEKIVNVEEFEDLVSKKNYKLVKEN